MTLKMLVFLADHLKRIQSELRAKELLEGLTMVYELPPDKFLALQQEVYKLDHPTMVGYVEKDQFEVDLIDVKFAFVKLPPEEVKQPEVKQQ